MEAQARRPQTLVFPGYPGGSEGSAMTFAQRTTTVTPGTNGITHDGVTCYRCNETGHYASDCPTDTNSTASAGTTLVQYGFTLAQGVSGIDPSWILLDSQSTISVFRNADMLTNIRPSEHVLRAVTNGGHQDSTLVGDFPNLGKVWFNPQSIANILSSRKFASHCVTAYNMVTTVANQKKLFSRRDVANADAARALYRMIGRPSEAVFQRILAGGFIRNCPVTPLDAKRALVIYGPDIATLKGKPRVPAPPRTHPRSNLFHCPLRCSTTTATSSSALIFLRPRPRLFSHHLAQHPVSHRQLRARPHPLYNGEGGSGRSSPLRRPWFQRVRPTRRPRVCLHSRRRRPIHLDVVAPDSHVGEIERSVRTVKERLRSTVHGLPFKRLPKLMVVHMVADAVRCLNMFPADNGVSPFLSPLSIVTGVPPPDYACLRLEFGTYVQLFQDHSPSNTIAARTLGAIALTPTGNAHGDYHFLLLASGCRVSRHRWTALPMTDIAIARVEALALHEKQPLIQEDGLVVEWRPNQPVDLDEYDRDYVPPLRADVDDPLLAADYPPIDPTELADLRADAAPPDDAPFPAVALEDQGAHITQPDANPHIDEPTENNGTDSSVFYEEDEEDADEYTYDDVTGDYTAQEDDGDYEQDYDVPHADADTDFNDATLLGDDDEAPDGLLLQDDTNAEEQGANTTTGTNNQGASLQARYNLRNRIDTTARRFRNAMDEPFNNKSYFPPTQLLQAGGDIFRYIMDMCATDPAFAYTMTQMSANAGIKKHGRKAMEALMAKFAQLEDLTAYEPLDPTKLTRAQKKSALRAINLIKEKRCGKLKGRTVADGRAQRTLYDKSETASPTVGTDSLMISIGHRRCLS
ncbi:Reverse transcriptase (RNA-dependent DNA polymerase) [Fragilaria crotonensis]|nr:Reverse transcriptase (RNA-dependent DNA polymerase) [Fragilaria crotonensis]